MVSTHVCATILWLSIGTSGMRFKVRSPARDHSADARRLSSIEQSILKAIADADAERQGLTHRLEAARARATVLLGSDVSDFATRDPESEQLLQQAEQDLMAGQKRVSELAAHIGHMSQVLESLMRK
jgi:hypothetical protein